MARVLWILGIVLGLALVGVGALAVLQNAGQTAQLGLDLGAVGAWRMVEPWPVLGLMGLTGLGALLLAALPLGWIVVRQKARIRALEVMSGPDVP